MVRVEQVGQVVDVLRGRNVLVVTGAGVSTDSGIPDYRGRGMLAKFPLFADKFEDDPIWRKRFWIRAVRQWEDWADAEPNVTHDVLASLENVGVVIGVVTQNVDGLHGLAGSQNVAEVHGNMFTSSCMSCDEQFDQFDVVSKVWSLNPKLLTGKRVVAKTFVEPMCDQCGGFLKPDVVFFGDYIMADQYMMADQYAQDSDAVLVLGTSMVVGTATPLVMDVRRRGGPVVVINRGRTLLDDVADVKVNASLADVMPDVLFGLHENMAGVS
jgi:NAD-dependent SIR2 family protein deacetylase